MPLTVPNCTYMIPTNTDQIEEYLDSHLNAGQGEDSDTIAIDTETTGLNIRKCKIVGMSVTASPGTGLYIPLNHEVGSHLNLRIVDVVEALIRGIKDRLCVYWNAKFDMSVMKRELGWIPAKWFDGPELAYLDNSDRRVGLKFMAKEILGADMDHFESIFDDPNYLARFGKKKRTKETPLLVQYLSPLQVLAYAGADSDYTLQLYNHFRFIKEAHPGPIKVDHALVPVLQRMELLGGLEINQDYVEEQIQRLGILSELTEQSIWQEAGYQFNIRSSQQVGELLYGKLGIPVSERTATGKPSTNADTLAKLDDYPVVNRLIMYSKLQTAQNSYFKKLMYVLNEKMRPYFNFNQYRVPTYRLASSGGHPDKDGTVGINIQAVSNGEVRDVFGVDVTENPLFEFHIDETHRDFLFVLPNAKKEKTDPQKYTCVRATCTGCATNCPFLGIDTTRVKIPDVRVIPSVRQSFRAPVGYVLLSFDYDRQEIVIATNLSREEAWKKAIRAGADIHAATAEAIWGDMSTKTKEVRAQLRTMAKAINFGIIYGMSAQGIAFRLGKSKAEGKKILEQYFEGLPSLKKWLDSAALLGIKLGYVHTYWKRKRWVDHIVAKGQKGHAERVAKNTPIQGTGAEITRMGMVRTDHYIKQFDPTFTRARMVYTLHDEIGVLSRVEDAQEVAEGVRQAMEFHVKGWDIQLSVGLKVGTVWGEQKEISWKEPIFDQVTL